MFIVVAGDMARDRFDADLAALLMKTGALPLGGREPAQGFNQLETRDGDPGEEIVERHRRVVRNLRPTPLIEARKGRVVTDEDLIDAGRQDLG